MAEDKVRAINYNMQEVGRVMKSSKKRFEWVVGLGKKTHTIFLDFSFISGKVKVTVDGRVILENQIPVNTSFQYPFTLEGFALNLIQQGQNCELRINNKVFSHLYIQEKTQQEFKKQESEFSINPDKEFMSKLNSTQKITLDVGNFKKHKRVAKDNEGDWGAFAGLGAPPGFEPPPGFQQHPTTEAVAQNAVQNKGPGVDFFDDDDVTPVPSVVTQQVKVTVPQSPTEIPIQSLYPQTNQSSQFYTQMPNSLDFSGTSLYQTSGVPQPQTNTLYNTGVSPYVFGQSNQPQSSILNSVNFGTNQQISQIPQIPQNSGFQTGFQSGFGLNTLYQTNLNLGGHDLNAMNTQSGNTFNLDQMVQQPSGDNFFNDAGFTPAEEPVVDPFGALESIAIQSNFHTTAITTEKPSPSDFFSQSQPQSQFQSIDLL